VAITIPTTRKDDIFLEISSGGLWSLTWPTMQVRRPTAEDCTASAWLAAWLTAVWTEEAASDIFVSTIQVDGSAEKH